jgi:hypothetical protein
VEALRLPASSVAAISCQNGLGVVGGRFYVDVSVPGDLWCCRRLVLSWIQACGGDLVLSVGSGGDLVLSRRFGDLWWAVGD